jgi:4-diphosphocytidyl-2-C-methyl-D-erythritol kinase
MTTVRALAPAKLNLGLEVIRKRPDGYHDIATVMQTVSIFDRLTISPSSDLRLHVSDPALADEDNLVVKTAALFGSEFEGSGGASIELTKRIPPAAGLGGASSDAAATLVASSHLWHGALDPFTIPSLAARIGSDVPFLLDGGTALVERRGEIRTPLRSLRGVWFVLVVPAVSIHRKTATLYAALSANDFTSGDRTRELAATLNAGEPPRPVLLINAFRRPLFALRPELVEFERLFANAGAPFVTLSGSGPTLYTILEDRQRAREIADAVRGSLPNKTHVYVCRPVKRAPLIRIDEF